MQTPRRSAFVILRTDSQTPDDSLTLWTVKRGSLHPPGGKLEEGETAAACVLREVAEETGIELTLRDLERTGVVYATYSDGSDWIEYYYTAWVHPRIMLQSKADHDELVIVKGQDRIVTGAITNPAIHAIQCWNAKGQFDDGYHSLHVGVYQEKLGVKVG